jgi:hypothetical protein
MGHPMYRGPVRLGRQTAEGGCLYMNHPFTIFLVLASQTATHLLK